MIRDAIFLFFSKRVKIAVICPSFVFSSHCSLLNDSTTGNFVVILNSGQKQLKYFDSKKL